MLGKFALALTMIVMPAAAPAAWRSATSTHFAVFTEGSEQAARDLAVKLEKFEFVMRTVSGVKDAGSPLRTSVFMLPNSAAVQATMPFGGGGSVAGYFDGSMRGPYAVMTRVDEGETFGLSAQTVLFHELSHQFMFRYFQAAYPSWYVEGFADFYGTMAIGANDRVEIGRPLENRLLSFQGNEWLPIGRVLAARGYGDVDNVLMLYAEGWLLVHYLSTTDKRPGQLKTYLAAINGGTSFEDAARQAFGDLNKLNSELFDYSHSGKQQTLVLPFKPIDPGRIELATLSPARNALIPFDIRIYAGVPASQAAAFADQVASVAARFPDDPYALSILTEAQRLAGRDDAALATIAHWIVVAPADGIPLMHRAAIEGARLAAAKSTDAAAWKAIRKLLVQANKLTPDDPRILRAYYDVYALQGPLPPVDGQNALVRAFELAPEVDDLRMAVALDFERRGLFADAIGMVRPLAFRTRAETDKSAAQKAREDKERARYRMAGDATPTITPRQVLARLEKEFAEQRAAK